jgi:methionine aminotransferase
MNTPAAPHTPALASRLPRVGTTIFTTMSALATETGAVNLGQGFPDFACDPRLVNAVTQAMQDGHNQYPPMPGVAALRQVMAQKMQSLYGLACDPVSEITVTAGATQAILTALLAIVHPGDEVIVLEPCYDSYVPNIELAGGVVVRVPLRPGSFRPDFDCIQAALSSRTRAILINSPHNPSGMVWLEADMLRLQELLAPTPVLLISDEVYEHMVFDGQQHHS